jgi:putative transcriptional regulator
VSVAHPAPEELMLDYAVGSTPPAMSLLVATHLAMCPGSRRLYEMLRGIGGALLDTLAVEPLRGISADGVLARAEEAARGGVAAIDRPAAGVKPRGPVAKFGSMTPPGPLLELVDEFASKRAWRALGVGVAAVPLSVSTEGCRAHLLWAKPGLRIAKHTHQGQEAVLVLKGAFWDRGERYGPGDVAVHDDATVHTPVIDRGEDCVCLAVTQAPVRFVGPLGWLLNRFCRF